MACYWEVRQGFVRQYRSDAAYSGPPSSAILCLDEARPVAAWPTGRDSSLPASRYDYCVASATPLAAFAMSAATAFGWDT